MRLTKKIGSGGEADVWECDDPSIVVKIYHESARTPARIAKVVWMTRHRVEGATAPFMAWPIEPYQESGSVVGFTMKKITAHPAEELLSNDKCLATSWLTRVRFSLNAARVTNALNAAGVVVGDLHASNWAYDEDGNAYHLDCDSIQVRDGPRLWPCVVCHNDSRPPELASVDLSWRHELSEETDRYMLAVLIFRMLMGAHPFAGVRDEGKASSSSSGLSSAVTRGDFLFAKDPSRVPPWCAEYDVVGEECKALFERAFVIGTADPSARPSAEEWIGPLVRLTQERQRRCPTHGGYPARLGACPFCSARLPRSPAPVAVVRGAEMSMGVPCQPGSGRPPAKPAQKTTTALDVIAIVAMVAVGILGTVIAFAAFIAILPSIMPIVFVVAFIAMLCSM